MVIKNVTESRTQCRIRIQGPLQSPRVRKEWATKLNFAEIEMPLAYLSIYFGVGRRAESQ